MKLKKNFLYQFGYQILAIILPLITSPYISRVLGAEAIGDYTYTYTVSYYFYIACMLGFDTYGQRRIASALDNKEDRDKAFSETVTLQVLITALGCFIYIIYCFLLHGTIRLLSFIQLFYLASAFTNIIWVFEGVEEFRSVALRNTIVKVVSTILIFTLVRQRSNLWVYTLIIAGSSFVGNLILIIDAKKYVTFRFPNMKSCIPQLKPIVLLFAPQIGITVFMQMDKLMLGWWSTSRQLGYYQNAEKIINVPVALILTVGTVMMPRIINLKANEEYESIKKYNSISMEGLMLIGVACTAGLAAIAPAFTPWFFGDDFVDGSSILSLLSFQVAFMAWENVLQKQYLVPFGRDKEVIKAMSFAALINIVLNTLLIPFLDANGAIIGSLVSHLFICIYEGRILWKNLDIKKYMINVLWFGFAGILMFAIIRAVAGLNIIQNTTILVLTEIVTGAVSYLIMVLAIIMLRKSDLFEYIKRMKEMTF